MASYWRCWKLCRYGDIGWSVGEVCRVSTQAGAAPSRTSYEGNEKVRPSDAYGSEAGFVAAGRRNKADGDKTKKMASAREERVTMNS